MVEELEHAMAQRCSVYAEIVGYGATSDGYDMVAQVARAVKGAMRMALDDRR